MTEPKVFFAQSGGQIAAILSPDGSVDGENIDSPRERDIEDVAAFLAGQVERASIGEKLFTFGVYIARKAGERETSRVAAVIERDEADARTEAERQAATIQVADGITVNIGNTVVPPTPEWFSKGEARQVSVGGERWTDQPVHTYRRVSTSHVFKMHLAGKLTERQFKACAWFRDRHELGGLTGNIKSVDFQPRIAGGTHGGYLFSASQIEAQDELRNARLLVPMRLRTFFDKVAIDDIPITRAARVAYAGRHALDSLRCCADRVADYIEYSTGKDM